MGNTSIDVLMRLLRKALLGKDASLPDSANWPEVMRLAAMHGLSAIAFDGLESLWSSANDIPKSIKLQWAALSLRQETLYKHNWNVACQLSELWKRKGIEALVLKGRTIAQYYPISEHRYSCDLDVFIKGENWEKACDVLKEQGICLVNDVYKEVEFTYNGVYVECHRYITPVRGNKTLLQFEKYLRNILSKSSVDYFEGTSLRRPSLLFVVLLYIEHALGDLLHGHLTLKHVVDWVVLRHQNYAKIQLEGICKKFGFERFLYLVDALADVVEGTRDIDSLPDSYKEVFDSLFNTRPSKNKPKSWFAKRVSLFFEILGNGHYYRDFGYCSMPNFLFNAVWSHLFHKKVEL